MSITLLRLAAWVLISLFAATIPSSAGDKITIFAASSLKDAVEELAVLFEAQCGCETRIVVGGSGTLARQIDAGAPADVYLSADPRWVDWLITRMDLANADQIIFAANKLVIISRPGLHPSISNLFQLDSIRFAIGEPMSVPAGAYAKEALTSVNLWQKLSKGAVRTENVRVALSMVEKGIVDAAIVYASDAVFSKGARISEINSALHSAIFYTAIAVGTNTKTTSRFLASLKSEKTKEVLARFGFQSSRH